MKRINGIMCFISNNTRANIIDVDKIDDNEYWVLFEFDCDPCEWYDKEESYCINYDEDKAPWCEAMENINIEVERVADLVKEEFYVEDCYESSEICNGMYIIL